MSKKLFFQILGIFISTVVMTRTAHAVNPRAGLYVGGTGTELLSFQINTRAQVDSLSGLATLSCRYSDGTSGNSSVSLDSGAGPIRMRNGVATLRNYRYDQSSDSVIKLNGSITAREARLTILLTSSESTCRGSLRKRVTRTTAPIVVNYDSSNADLRGSVAVTFTGSKISTYLVYVLGICNEITHVITVGDVNEPEGISYSSNGNFSFSKTRTGETATTAVTVTGVKSSTTDSYTLSVDGSVTNELGTCPFVGSFEATRR